jgi:hypothetical protein
MKIRPHLQVLVFIEETTRLFDLIFIPANPPKDGFVGILRPALYFFDDQTFFRPG